MFAWADIRMPIVSVNEAAHDRDACLRPAPVQQGSRRALLHRERARCAGCARASGTSTRKSRTVSYRPDGWREHVWPRRSIAPALSQLVTSRRRPGARRSLCATLSSAASNSRTPTGRMRPRRVMPIRRRPCPRTPPSRPWALEDCAIERCIFAHSGGYAVWFGRGSKRNQVLANEMFDLGAGGVKMGEAQQTPQRGGAQLRERHRPTITSTISAWFTLPLWASGCCKAAAIRSSHNHMHDLLLHGHLRRLDLGLRAESVQGQPHRVQPPPRHRQGPAERHGRHLHAGRAARHGAPQQPDPRHFVVHLRRLGHLPGRGLHRHADREQRRLQTARAPASTSTTAARTSSATTSSP